MKGFVADHAYKDLPLAHSWKKVIFCLGSVPVSLIYYKCLDITKYSKCLFIHMYQNKNKGPRHLRFAFHY